MILDYPDEPGNDMLGLYDGVAEILLVKYPVFVSINSRWIEFFHFHPCPAMAYVNERPSSAVACYGGWNGGWKMEKIKNIPGPDLIVLKYSLPQHGFEYLHILHRAAIMSRQGGPIDPVK
jgi:hypothetical protein